MLARERGLEEARDKMFSGGSSDLPVMSFMLLELFLTISECLVILPFIFNPFLSLLWLNSAQAKSSSSSLILLASLIHIKIANFSRIFFIQFSSHTDSTILTLVKEV